MSHETECRKKSLKKEFQSEVSSENPELLKRAREELNENPDCRDLDIWALRERVLDEPNLRTPTDDAFLLRFLRARKFDIERSFKLLKKYYTIREKYPELFTQYRPSRVLHALSEKMHFFLPHRDQEGRSILVIRAGIWDPKNSTPNDSMVIIHMCVDEALSEEEIQVHGVVVIFDMKNFGLAQAFHGTPSNARKTAALFQDCLPARFKGFHFIFEPAIFHLCFMVIMPFLKEKTSSRVHFHGQSLQSLHKHIHAEYLPEEYGGQKPSVKDAAVRQMESLLARDEEIANGVANSGYTRHGQ